MAEWHLQTINFMFLCSSVFIFESYFQLQLLFLLFEFFHSPNWMFRLILLSRIFGILLNLKHLSFNSGKIFLSFKFEKRCALEEADVDKLFGDIANEREKLKTKIILCAYAVF